MTKNKLNGNGRNFPISIRFAMWLKVLKQTDKFSIVQILGQPAVLKAMIPNLPAPGHVKNIKDVTYDIKTSQLLGNVRDDSSEPVPKRPKLY